MSTDGIALVAGYLVMVAAGLFAASLLLGVAFNLLWRMLRSGRKLWWTREAIKHYKKIKPHPAGDES